MKKTLLGTLVVFIVLSATGCYLVDRPIKSAYEVSEKTFDGDNIIYNYEWFKQQKEDIDALGKKIQTAQLQADNFRNSAGERSEWTFEDKTEDARLQIIVAGLTNQLTQAVADYNARSKMANRNIFEDGTIPDLLEVGSYILK